MRAYKLNPLFSETGSASSLSLPLALDVFTAEFEAQSLNANTLFSMVASSAACKLTRLVATASLSSILNSTFSLKFIAGFSSLSAEVFTFEASSRLCSRALFEWEGEQGFRKGLLHGFLSFGSLRLVPHSTQMLLLRHLFQDAAIVASHHLESICFDSPSPEGGIAWQLIHAELMLLQIHTGMAFFHGLTGHRAQVAERSVDFKADLRIQNRHSNLKAHEFVSFHRLDDNPLEPHNPTRTLLRRFQAGEKKAEQELLRESMSLLYSYVRRYKFSALDEVDLMQEASIALFNTAKAFDVNGEKPFYLKYEILSHLRAYVRENISDVRLSGYKHDQLYQLKRVMDDFERRGEKPELEAIALALQCSTEKVLELNELNLLLTKTNLEDRIDENLRRIDRIASEPISTSRVEVGDNEIQAADPVLLKVFLEVIVAQEARIFRERLLQRHPTPLHDLARSLNVNVDDLAFLEKEISEAFVLFQRFSKKCPLQESLSIQEKTLLTRVRAGIFRIHLGESAEFERFAFVNFESYLQLGLIPKRVDHRLSLLRWMSNYVSLGEPASGWAWMRQTMGPGFVRDFWQPAGVAYVQELDLGKMRTLFQAVHFEEPTVGKSIEWQILLDSKHIASSTPLEVGMARKENHYTRIIFREYESGKYEILVAGHMGSADIVSALRESALCKTGALRIPSDGWLALRVMNLQDISKISKRDVDYLFEDFAKKTGTPLENLEDLVWQFNLFKGDKIVAPRAYLPGTEVVSSALCSILFHREPNGRYEIRRAYPARVNRVLDAFEESEFYRSEDLNIRQGGWLGYRAFNVSDFMELRKSDVENWIGILAKRVGIAPSKIKEFVLETNILKNGNMMWPQPLLPHEISPSGIYYKIHFRRRLGGGFIVSFGGRSRGRALDYFLSENELVHGPKPLFEVRYTAS